MQWSRASAEPGVHWVNDLTYGSRGGGFYWDPSNNLVWTAERGWHQFSPDPPREATPLWVNDLTYGSVGQGFYLDPLNGMVWTAERGWHFFNPGGVTPSAPGSGPARVGDVVDAAGSYYRVNAIIDNYAGSIFKPHAGNRFFVVDITQIGTAEGDPYNPFYFHVQTSDSFVYSCSGLGAPEPGFTSGDMHAGQRIRGYVACELPIGATVVSVRADPNVFGADVEIADLALGTAPARGYPSAIRPAGPPVGSSTDAAGSRYTVNAVIQSYADPLWKPHAGNRFFAVDITQFGVVQGDPYNPFYFHVQTSDDFYYDCSGLGAPDPSFSSGDLNSGQQVRGWVACEIPANAVVFAIYADPEPLGGSIVIAVP
jgi:hypothetical protein